MKNKTIFEWAEIFQEQIQNGASQSDIIQMLEEYGNQALRIHGVVGRSEQLKAVQKLKDFAYEVCPLHREDDLEEIVGSL